MPASVRWRGSQCAVGCTVSGLVGRDLLGGRRAEVRWPIEGVMGTFGSRGRQNPSANFWQILGRSPFCGWGKRRRGM
jgi:hypothetical protein